MADTVSAKNHAVKKELLWKNRKQYDSAPHTGLCQQPVGEYRQGPKWLPHRLETIDFYLAAVTLRCTWVVS